MGARLRLGDGDLLAIDVPNSQTLEEPDAKRARHSHRTANGVHAGKANSTVEPEHETSKRQKGKKGWGRVAKPPLVWKIKATPHESTATSEGSLVTAPSSVSSERVDPANGLSVDKNIISELGGHCDGEVAHQESSFWNFLISPLCGMCC